MFKMLPIRFGFKAPVIIQAPMAGGITTPHLVAAVSNAHGLGSYATGYLTKAQVEADLHLIKNLTSRPFAANLFIPPTQTSQDIAKIAAYQLAINRYKKILGMPEHDESLVSLAKPDNFHEIVESLLIHKVPIVSFTFGNLSTELINEFKKNGTYLVGTATSLEEAQILVDSNIDAIVAQGIEAGGHRGGFFTEPRHALSGTAALVAQIVKHIDSHPVIAAGGIMDGCEIKTVLALGASAVQMGTAFLTTKESGATDTYKTALIKCRGLDHDPTGLTTAFSGKLARGIENQVMREINEHETPEYPIPHLISAAMRREAARQGKSQFMSLWCGQGINKIRNEIAAADLINQLRDEVKSATKISMENISQDNRSTLMLYNNSQWQLKGNSPRIYDQYIVSAVSAPWYSLLYQEGLPYINQGKIADLGCGTGAFLIHLLKNPNIANKNNLVGIDCNSEMLALAREKTLKSNNPISWIEANASKLPFENDDFHLIYCQQGIQYFENKLDALKEIHRILDSQGVFIATVWSSIENCSGYKYLADTILSRVGDSAKKNLYAPFNYSDPDELYNLAKSAGFQSINIQLIDNFVHFKSINEFARYRILGSPLVENISEDTIEQVISCVIEKLEYSMQSYQDKNGLHFPVKANFLVAKK